MNELIINTYLIKAKVTKPVNFDYFPGFVLRNALLRAMADLYCQKVIAGDYKPSICDQCQWLENCLYHKLNLPVFDIKETKPQAYIIDGSGIDINVVYGLSSFIEFKLTLFGWANHFLLNWIYALQHIGEKTGLGKRSGGFELQAVIPINDTPHGQSLPVFGRLNFQFRSLHFDKKLSFSIDNIPFDEFFKKIQNRLISLAVEYGNSKKMDAITVTSDTPKNIESQWDIVRLPYPPRGNMPYYDCFRGFIVFEGYFAPYIEWLRMGSKTGFGQLTSSGLGIYSMLYERPL